MRGFKAFHQPKKMKVLIFPVLSGGRPLKLIEKSFTIKAVMRKISYWLRCNGKEQFFGLWLDK
jgi:hypothetical protein